MDLGSRGRPIARNGVVAAGSVWESRMKLDECKGGIKVFNAEEEKTENSNTNTNTNTNTSTNGLQVYKRMRPKQSIVGVSGKRKTWKSESSEGFDKSPIQIVKQRSELDKNLDQQCKELSQSADGIRKSPIGIKKTRSEVSKELSVSFNGTEKSPIHSMRTRSRSQIGSSESSGERNLGELSRAKMEITNRVSDESGDGNGDLRKVKSVADKASDESVVNLNGLINGTESDSVEIIKEGSDKNSGEIEKEKDDLQGKEILDESVVEKGIENNSIGSDCEEYDVCKEKMITSNLGLKLKVGDENNDDWEEEFEKIEVKEISVEEEKPKKVVVMEENKIQGRVENPLPSSEIKPKKMVIEERKVLQRNEKTIPNSPIVRKLQPPIVNNPRIIPKQTKTPSIPVSDRYQRVPRTHNKLQSLVDLVMWKDASKSAFVFGAGTFIIISSSYTTDLNISFISVVSYLGLVYLAAIFLFRSIICRGAINVDDTSHVVGEEEAIWLLKLILPYINEFLLKLKALFSGDPATTMKLAVLLFVLARCGSYITIWKMAKLGFFGVFTVPKICSSYSAQLTACGTFWIQRFRDAWESCAHKKPVAFSVFALVWNMSSVVARIWAVFMLFVAFRYYQHSLLREDNWVEDEDEDEETTVGTENSSGKGPVTRPRQRGGPSLVASRKQKKLS